MIKYTEAELALLVAGEWKTLRDQSNCHIFGGHCTTEAHREYGHDWPCGEFLEDCVHCGGRNWVATTSMPRIMAAIRAHGGDYSIESHLRGDCIIVSWSDDDGISEGTVDPADGLRDAHALLLAVARALELVGKVDEPTSGRWPNLSRWQRFLHWGNLKHRMIPYKFRVWQCVDCPKIADTDWDYSATLAQFERYGIHIDRWEARPAKTTRIVIEVDGYRWRVHGAKDKLRWRSHLVELLGAERLDLEVEVVAAISTDLILAW